jgi:hypothetical protein
MRRSSAPSRSTTWVSLRACQFMLLVAIVKVIQLNNAAFTPQVYAFSLVLLRYNDVDEHHIGNKMLTVMPVSNTDDQMIRR